MCVCAITEANLAANDRNLKLDVYFGKRDSIQTRRRKLQAKMLATEHLTNAKLALLISA
jgi:hypothetical protein